MKKLLSILGAVGIVASSASTVVACGPKVKEIPFDKYDYGKDLGLITDTGKINDKSFNQSGYEAGNAFATALGQNKEITKIEPETLSDIKTSYSKIIKNNGVNTLILPGFQHQDYIETASKIMGEHRSAVFLDGDTNGTSNVIGLKYKADISGFYAGIASIIEYFQLKPSETNVELATFGGIANPVAVTSYMTGFMASIDAFNELMKDNTFKSTFFSTAEKSLGEGEEISYKASRTDLQKNNPNDDTDAAWFTNSFGIGDAKSISANLVKRAGNSGLVIFPVAGPQTADVLEAIRSNAKMYVAGVDTDQVNQYAEADADKFLTSGLKDLKGSTEISLAHTVEYADQVSQEALDKLASDNGINMDNMSFVDGTTDEAVTDATKIAELKAAGSDWDGYEVWFDGSFAHGGKNKVTDELHNNIVNFFPRNELDLTTASKNFLDKAAASSDSKSLLTKDAINAWLKDAKIVK